MANHITWPKDIRDKAKERKKTLIAFGCTGMEMVGMTEAARAQVMSLLYVNYICNQKSFEEALAKTLLRRVRHLRRVRSGNERHRRRGLAMHSTIPPASPGEPLAGWHERKVK